MGPVNVSKRVIWHKKGDVTRASSPPGKDECKSRIANGAAVTDFNLRNTGKDYSLGLLDVVFSFHYCHVVSLFS